MSSNKIRSSFIILIALIVCIALLLLFGKRTNLQTEPTPQTTPAPVIPAPAP